MPTKILTLIRHLESVNFVNKNGRSGYRNYQHPKGINITISGNSNHDAKQYQIKDVKRAIELVNNE